MIAGHRIQPLFSPGFAQEFAGRDPYQMFLNRLDLPEGAPRDPLNQSMWLWLKSTFPNKLLNFLGDRSEMAHSIEAARPSSTITSPKPSAFDPSAVRRFVANEPEGGPEVRGPYFATWFALMSLCVLGERYHL